MGLQILFEKTMIMNYKTVKFQINKNKIKLIQIKT